MHYIKLFPKQQILDSSKLKEFADDNSKLDENGRTFSKKVEKTVGKGEIARYEQFLLFPQCFQKTCTTDTLKPGLVWERYNGDAFFLTHRQSCFLLLFHKSICRDFQSFDYLLFLLRKALILFHKIHTFNDLEKEAF